MLFRRAEYQMIEFHSACHEVVSTNVLKYEDIHVKLYWLMELILHC